MPSHCHHLPFTSIKLCWNSIEMSWNVLQLQAHHQCHYPPMSHIEQWKGPTLKFLHLVPLWVKNLTWLDKTHAFTVWEGFKAQGCMSCLHNLWDHPHFHKCSSWSLIVIILHSSPMPLSSYIARSVVNGANVQIPSTCACMHLNLAWLDKTHAFTAWEGFKAQGCMSCPHILWDCPHFHQRSSCSLIVIIRHSRQ